MPVATAVTPAVGGHVAWSLHLSLQEGKHEPETTQPANCHLALLLMPGTHQKCSPGESAVWADSGRGRALTPILSPWPTRAGVRTGTRKPLKLIVMLVKHLPNDKLISTWGTGAWGRKRALGQEGISMYFNFLVLGSRY